jgi:hypothetical protein
MDEFRQYLEKLLRHVCPDKGKCVDCESLQHIYSMMRSAVFSTVIYSGTALQERRPSRVRSADADQPAPADARNGGSQS